MPRTFPCPLGRIIGVNYWTDCPEFESEDKLRFHLENEHSIQATTKTLARIVAQEKPSKYRKTFMAKGREMVKPYEHDNSDRR